MRAGFKALIRLVSCAGALGLAGCSHDPDTVISGALHNMGRQAETVVYADGPPAGQVTWEAPIVHAAGYAPDAGGPYLLDTGDKLRVFVYGQPNLSRAYTVDHDGMITVPLINEVRARGRTTREVEDVIRHRLGAEFVRDPQVTVDILQNRPFFIYGEVRNGGQYPFVSGMTVETAIAIAGGYTDRASTRSYRVTRRNGGFMDQIEAPADFAVLPGDVVYVNERFF
ncbi:polysaccharide biosynthesis/export family protein [Hyphomicrobium sp.]|uniref:polysaccharide biosynthesis/export family protein n=1 Tax=Hyphomicrobium sp. TaxID=82 RepID=UPI0025C00695|nr:polysaccharide biosynthesis/export family protein [Hyphomicrobium sp.]MCC7254160.1 polysaccharide export protein [Hyphomicrobium sp.]